MSEKFPFTHFLKKEPCEPQSVKATNIAIPNKNSPTINNNSTNQNGDFSSVELMAINAAILDFIREMISPQKFSAFFDHFQLVAFESELITFKVNAPFIKAMILAHHLPQVEEAVSNVLGKHYNVSIQAGTTLESLSPNKNNILHSLQNEEKRPKTASDVKFSVGITPTTEDLQDRADAKYIEQMEMNDQGMLLDPRKTFDTFVVGPSNNMAYATALAVAENPGKNGKYPSLYLYSNSGLGKTHLLHSVGNKIKDNYPHLVICLTTAREFMKEMISAIQHKTLDEFQKKYSETVDVLMLDDIQELKNKKGTQDEFFHIFNELYNKGKQLIFTSDKDPSEIDGLEERIKTRLQWGLVIDIQMPDLETKIAIVKKKANEFDLFLSEDVINLVASNVKRSIREIEGSLAKLAALNSILKTDIDVSLVKEQLMIKDFSEDLPRVSLEAVAKATGQMFKITIADLKSKARNKEITQARHVAMYLSQKLVGATLNEIGKFYGGRDHASVIHAINKTKERLKDDAQLSKLLVNIESLL